MKVTARQRTDSTGRIIIGSVGCGFDELRTGGLGGLKEEPNIWDVRMHHWREWRLSQLIRDHYFSLLATYVRTDGCVDTKMVSYASNEDVVAIRVEQNEYRTRNRRGMKCMVYKRKVCEE